MPLSISRGEACTPLLYSLYVSLALSLVVSLVCSLGRLVSNFLGESSPSFLPYIEL